MLSDYGASVEKKQHGLVRAKDGRQRKESIGGCVSEDNLQRMQKEDETLKSVREAAEGKTEWVDSGYFEKDGLIYQRWIPVGAGAVEWTDQIVLPKVCRLTVLHLAHAVPFLGDPWKEKDNDAYTQSVLLADPVSRCYRHLLEL